MGEAIAGIIEGLIALLELLIHGILLLVKGSVALIAFIVSPSYRASRNREWQGKPVAKVLTLAFSGLCLATLFGLVTWLAVISFDSKAGSAPVRSAKATGSNHLSFDFRSTSREGTNRALHISIAEGGVERILAASNRADLLTQVKSIKLVTGATNAGGTNLSPGRSFEFKLGRTVTEK